MLNINQQTGGIQTYIILFPAEQMPLKLIQIQM